MLGVPWEPIPGRGVTEIKSRAHIKGVRAGENIIPEPEVRQAVPRRMRLDVGDFEKYGFTTGCPECRSKSRMDFFVNHSEYCRQRFQEKMRVEDPDRYNRTSGGLAEETLKKEVETRTGR